MHHLLELIREINSGDRWSARETFSQIRIYWTASKLKLTGFNLRDRGGFPVITKIIELFSALQLPNHQVIFFYRLGRHIKNKEDLIYADDSPLFSCWYMWFHE